jgi:hypothetical protein
VQVALGGTVACHEDQTDAAPRQPVRMDRADA